MFTGYLRDITDRKQAEAELRASRARLVEIADTERRRIQRNLHDGAQQRITAVLLSLGRLREAPQEHAALIDLAIDELSAGLEEIRELASGLHPSVLSERGLVKALEALALRAGIPIDLQADVRPGLPEQLEAAAYYVVAEGLANTHKHAGASSGGDPHRGPTRTTLVVEVLDDGVGGADEEGSGLRGLADRVEALGGTLALESPSWRRHPPPGPDPAALSGQPRRRRPLGRDAWRKTDRTWAWKPTPRTAVRPLPPARSTRRDSLITTAEQEVMNLNIDALEASFDHVAPRGDELMDVFYARLFAVAPGVRPLFAGTDLKRQKGMLLAALVLLRSRCETSRR